jgi:tol-pal system protein YbgF
MMMIRRRALLMLLLATTAVTMPAQAQDESTDQPGGGNPEASAAQFQVRISQLEEQLRNEQGEIERVSFENKRLKEQLEKTSSDIQYRLTALENKQAAAAPAPVAPGAAVPEDTSQLKPVEPVAGSEPDDINGLAAEKSSAPDEPQFSSARDQYNYAFGLLNRAQYAKAGEAFASFTKRYPKDPLIGNAYYWLGETQYVRRDYVKAADNFRQGYEVMPTGPKAADNLLKLSMALGALNKNHEACVVLKQVLAKFSSSSSSVKPHAEQEMNRLGCS